MQIIVGSVCAKFRQTLLWTYYAFVIKFILFLVLWVMSILLINYILLLKCCTKLHCRKISIENAQYFISVLHKRGKLISFLRAFFSSRPTRSQLKQTGIVKERVFGCDLGEHLQNSGHEGQMTKHFMMFNCLSDIFSFLFEGLERCGYFCLLRSVVSNFA